jgi:3-hydroxyisobutyrate dehydrogenase-like beta-hydroxyacid dehydrogenase
MQHTQETVGFIGPGMMGHGIAKNIVEKGYALSFYSRTYGDTAKDLESRGAVYRASACEVAGHATVVFLCVTGSKDVESIVYGVNGLAAGLQPGSVLVDCSTSDPTSTVALAEKLAHLGVTLVDAPLGRTPKEAWAGTLDTMVGADEATFARIEPVLQTWAGRIVRVGNTGDGHRMKLINNFLALGYAALYAEALTLAKAVNIEPARFDSVIRNGRMDCLVYQTFMDYVLNGNKEGHKFTIRNAFKDMRYLESMADDAGLFNGMGNAVKNAYALAMHNGDPDVYVPTLAETIARVNGLGLQS